MVYNSHISRLRTEKKVQLDFMHIHAYKFIFLEPLSKAFSFSLAQESLNPLAIKMRLCHAIPFFSFSTPIIQPEADPSFEVSFLTSNLANWARLVEDTVSVFARLHLLACEKVVASPHSLTGGVFVQK